MDDVRELLKEFSKLEIVGMVSVAVVGLIGLYVTYCFLWLLGH